MKTKRFFAGIVILGYILFNYLIFNFFIADLSSTQGKKILMTGDFVNAGEYINSAVSLNQMEPTYRRNKALMYLSLALSGILSEEEMSAVKERAYEELKASYTLQPINLVNIKSLIPMYYFLSLNDITDPSKGFDENYKAQAGIFLRQVKNLAPTDADLALTIGKHFKLLGMNEEAKESLEKALMLRPSLDEAKAELNSIK